MFSYRVDENIELKLLEKKHAEEVFAAVSANMEHLRPWMPWVDDEHSSADTEAFIIGELHRFANNNGFTCGIWNEGIYAGNVSIHNIDWSNRKTSIGYWLSAEQTGKGVMTKACRALLSHAFETLSLNRVELRAAVENVKSRAVAERLGFVREGIVRQELLVRDRYLDHVMYGMLAKDWKLQKPHT